MKAEWLKMCMSVKQVMQMGGRSLCMGEDSGSACQKIDEGFGRDTCNEWKS